MLRGRRQTYLVALETKVLSQRNVGLSIPGGRIANRSNRKYLQENPTATVGVLSRGRFAMCKVSLAVLAAFVAATVARYICNP
jgi:hypothetical protein